MNRAQRRREQKEQNKLLKSKINRVELVKEITHKTTETYNAALALVLRDQYGYGKKRLNDFFTNMCEVVKEGKELREKDTQEKMK